MPGAANIREIAENYLRTLVHESDENFVALVGENAAIEDPRKGRVTGGGETLSQFAHDTKVWLEYRNAKVQFLRTTAADKRVACESILHMHHQGESISLPVGVVVTNNPDGSAEIHVHHTMWPFNRVLKKRLALYPPEHVSEGEHTDVIEEYFEALVEGSVKKILATMEADVYFRESSGPPYVHWGHAPVADYFEKELFSAGAPMIKGETITDDGNCVVMEFTVYGWDGVERDPNDRESGLAVYERSKYGKISAVRIYDEVAF